MYDLPKDATDHKPEEAEPEEQPPEEGIRVTTMAGQLVVALPAVTRERAMDLKQRIFAAEGTPTSCQKLIQGPNLLQDADEVSPVEPVLLVRMQRKLVVVTFTNQLICVWDLNAGEGLQRFRGHRHVIKSVAADWNSMLCFTGAGDRTVCVWSIASGECKRVFSGFKGWVSRICLDPDGDQLVAADMEGALRLCHFGQDDSARAQSFPLVETPHRGDSLQISVDWSRKRALVFSAQSHGSMYDLLTGTLAIALTDEGSWLKRTLGTHGLEVDWETRSMLLTCHHRLALFSLVERGSCADLRPKTVASTNILDVCFGPQNAEEFRVNWHRSLVLVLTMEPMCLEIWSLESRELLKYAESPDSSLGRILSLDVEWESDVGIRVTTAHGILEPVVFQNWTFGHGESKVQTIVAQLHFENDSGRGGSSPISLVTSCVAKP